MKIGTWEKRNETDYLIEWRNMKYMETEDRWATIEEVSIGKNYDSSWSFVYYSQKYMPKQINFKTKEEAYKTAIRFMKKYPKGR